MALLLLLLFHLSFCFLFFFFRLFSNSPFFSPFSIILISHTVLCPFFISSSCVWFSPSFHYISSLLQLIFYLFISLPSTAPPSFFGHYLIAVPVFFQPKPNAKKYPESTFLSAAAGWSICQRFVPGGSCLGREQLLSGGSWTHADVLSHSHHPLQTCGELQEDVKEWDV